MFDALMKKVVKKFVIGKINDLLQKYKGNVDTVRAVLVTWIARLEKVLSCFKFFLAKIEDNELDENEAKETADEVAQLIKEW